MIRTLYFSHDGKLRSNVQPDEYPIILKDKQGLIWVDFCGEAPQVCEPILHETFGFHPLAVDDALQESHVPKVDDWESFLYIVMHSIQFDNSPDEGAHIDTEEVDVFLTRQCMVTHHDMPIPALDRVWALAQRDDRKSRNGADHLLYHLSDELVADFMHVVEALDDEIEGIEDEIFNNPTQAILERTFSLKRAMLKLRRTLLPLREVLNKLARDEYPVIDAKDKVYFRDVYDHLVRLHDITESLRDLVGGVLDSYLSIVNNRMNDIMKTLTVITTLFMPISFLASFFGMNFFQPVAAALGAWTTLPSFLLTLLIMIAVPVGMFLWIRRKGWM